MTVHIFNTNPQKTTLNYLQAKREVQKFLNQIPYGELKVFCQNHNLPYREVIKLKNDSLNFCALHIVKTVLEQMGHSNVQYQCTHLFTFDK